MAGALPEAELLNLARHLGFVDVRLTEHFDAYGNTPVLDQVAAHLGVQGANIHAHRPKMYK